MHMVTLIPVIAVSLVVSSCDGGSSGHSRSVASQPESPPVTTLTGYLVDAGVSGVQYLTPSHDGLTEDEGAFRYEPGESVRFRLGTTELGEVHGQAQVTPFDLAGSAIVTGTPAIAEVLEKDSSPFHTSMNTAVLLQSLDFDAVPENGVDIPGAVAALLEGVTLDLDQHWRTFSTDPNLLRVIQQANEQMLFTDTRATVNPAAALQHLYGSLGVDGRTLAVSMVEKTGEEAIAYHYDDAGYLQNVVRPAWYKKGDEAKDYLVQEYSYDGRGNIIRFDEERYHEFEGEIFGTKLTIIDSQTYRETRSYNTNGDVALIRYYEGNLQQFLTPGDVASTADIPFMQVSAREYSYDSDGKLLKVDFNAFRSGEPDGVAAFHYDEDGRLLLVNVEGSRVDQAVAALDIPEIELLYLGVTYDGSYSVSYEYGGNGQLLRDVREGMVPELGRSTETRDYDHHGKLTRLETSTDNAQYFRNSLIIIHYEYDEHGNRVRETRDIDGDGVIDQRGSWTYRYDDHGQAIRMDYDTQDDGIVDEFHSWEYDNRGNLIAEEWSRPNAGPHVVTRREYDDEGYLVHESGTISTDVSYRYEPTGWGHLFSETVREVSTN
jgi:hypothetical protein